MSRWISLFPGDGAHDGGAELFLHPALGGVAHPAHHLDALQRSLFGQFGGLQRPLRPPAASVFRGSRPLAERRRGPTAGYIRSRWPDPPVAASAWKCRPADRIAGGFDMVQGVVERPPGLSERQRPDDHPFGVQTGDQLQPAWPSVPTIRSGPICASVKKNIVDLGAHRADRANLDPGSAGGDGKHRHALVFIAGIRRSRHQQDVVGMVRVESTSSGR